MLASAPHSSGVQVQTVPVAVAVRDTTIEHDRHANMREWVYPLRLFNRGSPDRSLVGVILVA